MKTVTYKVFENGYYIGTLDLTLDKAKQMTAMGVFVLMLKR